MRSARQISAQARAKAKKIDVAIIGAGKENPTLEIAKAKAAKLPVIKPIPVTKLVAPNARIAEKLSKPKVAVEPVVAPIILPADCLFYIDGFFKDNPEDRYYVINANGYTKEQLSTELPKEDIDYIEQGIKIPVNFGLGVEVLHKGDRLLYKRGGNSWRAKPTVTLEISTWRGVSVGALHYYGKLNICLPEACYVGNPEKENYTTSTYIPMYQEHDIELTQELEQWEIDKYPDNYRDYYRAGQRHRGFYTKKQVREYAELVFEQIFEKGWLYRVDDRG